MIVSTVLFTLVGLLLAGASVPLARRRVPPQRGYGLRVPATFADEWVWYEANARSGRDFLVFGLAFAVVAATLPLLAEIDDSAYTLVMAAVLVAGVSVVAIVGTVRANRLLRQRKADQSDSGR